MESEVSSGAHLGVVLIALAAIIAIGFGVFGIAKAIANDGTAKVETSLNNVSEQEFRDFDQVVCTGTQVKSAMQNFAGKNVAILIATQGVTDAVNGVTSNFTTNNLPGLEDVEKEVETAKVPLYMKIGTKTDSGSTSDVSPVTVLSNTANGKGGYVDPIFVNYNAMLWGDNDTPSSYTTADPRVISMEDGVLIAKNGVCSNKSGTVQFNLRTAACKKSGTAEYIAPTSRFNSYTIKDSTGTYIGVAFVQINTK